MTKFRAFSLFFAGLLAFFLIGSFFVLPGNAHPLSSLGVASPQPTGTIPPPPPTIHNVMILPPNGMPVWKPNPVIGVMPGDIIRIQNTTGIDQKIDIITNGMKMTITVPKMGGQVDLQVTPGNMNSQILLQNNPQDPLRLEP